MTQIDLVQDLKHEYKSANKTADAHNKKQLFWSKITTVLLFLTAGLALWQGFSSNRAANAAKSAANTAEKTLGSTLNNFYIEQRAYVIGEQIDFTFNRRSDLHLVFRNGGRTPAVNFTVDPQNMSITLEDGPPFRSPPREDNKLANLVIGSDKTVTIDIPVIIPDNLIPSFIEKDKLLIFKGKATYQDIFGCLHETLFCSEIRNSWKEGTQFCPKGDGVNAPDQNSCDKISQQ